MLVDTSAWVEFLRGTGSDACATVRLGIRERTLAVTDPVLLELLSGAHPNQVDRSSRPLSEQDDEPVAARLDRVDAAGIFRSCRRRGVTIRSQTDCLIAAVAARTGRAVLHHDRDFDLIARHTGLCVV